MIFNNFSNLYDNTMLRLLKIFLFLTLLSIVSAGISQENIQTDNPETMGKPKPFKIGMYIGAYFANKYTASAYDGYGYDIDGIRNATFETSYMYQKIINEYGGYNGYGVDQIAQALKVNHGDW